MVEIKNIIRSIKQNILNKAKKHNYLKRSEGNSQETKMPTEQIEFKMDDR